MTQARSQKTTERNRNVPVGTSTEKADHAREELEAVDELMEEIDDLLEENAQDFVKNYVQKGGQ